MAVILNPNDPNKQQNQAQTGPDGKALQTTGTAAPAGQGPAGSPMARTQANSLAQTQRPGSGRFTNIQKYIQANKQGGQQVANQVGQGLQKQFGQNEEQAQKYYSQLGQNIEQANKTAQQGQGFQQQLRGIGSQIKQVTLTPEQLADQQQSLQKLNERSQQDLSSIDQFAQQPDFQRFQDIQAGRGIDENLLALQQQRSLSAAQQAAQGSQQAQQALGSEGGRFELLRKTFGGDGRSAGYTQGQQRLDQVLLGQGGGLSDLQAKAIKQTATNLDQQQKASASLNDVNRLIAQEKGLVSDIGTQASSNEQAYMDMLSSYMNPLNQQRTADFEKLGSAIGTYVPGNKTYEPGFNEDQMSRLGLTDKNQGVYNVFKDEAFTQAPGQTPEAKNAALANVIATKGREARNAQDIANQDDVRRYQTLAKIRGIDPTQHQITKESDIGQSYTNKEEGKDLKSRLTAAQTAFDTEAQKRIKGTSSGSTAKDVNIYQMTPEQVARQSYTNPIDNTRGGIYAAAESAATAQDLINQGRGALSQRANIGQDLYDRYGNEINTNYNQFANQYVRNSYDASGNVVPFQRYTDWLALSTTNPLKNQSSDSAVSQLQNLLTQQNYNQTLGGRRETFIDTEAAQRLAAQGLSPKSNPIPVTSVDPSLAYRNAINGFIKGNT